MATEGRLLLLAPASAAADSSPEFRYLREYRLLQARRVFASVEEAELGRELPAWDDGRTDCVLLLTSPNVLIGAATLGAMRACLAGGARLALPYLLASVAGALPEPVHTLRGFERAESGFLRLAPGHRLPRPQLRPAALFSAPALAALSRRVPLPALVGAPDLPEGERERLATAHVGLCHEFIDYYGEPRADILRFVPPTAKDVLEIGCARGATGRLLQDTLGCRVTGVELNPVVAREAAAVLHRVVCGDIERIDLEGAFDAVVATELFEHLADPFAFLARARSLLRPGGRIILSTPNTGHYSIVEDLVAGRWDYVPIGLLCYTHLRFFTEATLRDWLGMAGFASYEIVPQTTELPERFRSLRGILDVNEASLGTKGFYVVIDVPREV